MYIERLDEGVYRVHKHDLRHKINEVFDELVEAHKEGFAYRIATSRHDSRLNGHSAYVKQSDNDFRKFALILLHVPETVIEKKVYTHTEYVEVPFIKTE